MTVSILVSLANLTVSLPAVTETKQIIAPQLLVKLHLKMIEVYGNAVILKSILVNQGVL